MVAIQEWAAVVASLLPGTMIAGGRVLPDFKVTIRVSASLEDVRTKRNRCNRLSEEWPPNENESCATITRSSNITEVSRYVESSRSMPTLNKIQPFQVSSLIDQ